MNVPGRKSIVIAAIVIIDELSLSVASAILLEVWAISILIRLSLWLARLKYKLIRTCVRVL